MSQTRDFMLYARKKVLPDGSCRLQDIRSHLDHVKQIASYKALDKSFNALLELICELHDSGKCDSGWQDFLLYNKEKVCHSPMSTRVLAEILDGEDTAIQETLCLIAGPVLFGHHAGLPDMTTKETASFYQWAKGYPLPDKFQEIIDVSACKKLAQKAYAEILHYLNSNNFDSDKNGKLYYLHRYLLSVLVYSDWADASTWEKEASPMECVPPPCDWAHLRDSIEAYADSLKATSTDGINTSRQQLSDEAHNKAFSVKPGIYRLPSPVGLGKTLASMRFAIEYASQSCAHHIIYAAPYNTILRQSKDAFSMQYGLPAGMITKSFGNMDVETTDEDYGQGYIREQWNTPIIMTSMVQLLNAISAGYQGDTLRFSSLYNSVIIIDEAQYIPYHSISIFNDATKWLCSFGKCIILLCTATQLPFDSNKLDVPIRYNQNADLITISDVLKKKTERVKYIDDTSITKSMDAQHFSRYVFEKSQQKSTLCIVNTKALARKLYQNITQMAPDRKLFYLSRTLCQDDINTRIAEIKQALQNHLPILVISTQLIEAGIDLSFQTLIRTVTGIPAIIQSAGRVNRNRESASGLCYIVDCYDEKCGGDLKKEKEYAYRILYKVKRGDYDLDSKQAIDDYANTLFSHSGKGRHSDTSFPLPDKDSTLLAELQVMDYRASRNYRVIDDANIPILVPYKKGKDIIQILLSTASIPKEAAQYTVNIPQSATANYSSKNGFFYASSYDKDFGIVG